MKSRITLAALLVALFVLAQGSTASAQAIGVYSGHSDNPNGPTVSPYLNLLQNNNFGGAQYQTLVKPFVDQSAALKRQGDSLQRLQQTTNQMQMGMGGGAGRVSATGHTTHFMNHLHYFPGGQVARVPR